MENLLKCPFCGKEDVCVSTDEDIEGLDEGTGFLAVVCSFTSGGCGATGGYRETKKEAIEIWNRRTS